MLEQYSDVLTPEELCEILMIGKNMGYHLLQTRQIEAFRIGRMWKIPKSAVIQYICTGGVLPAPPQRHLSLWGSLV